MLLFQDPATRTAPGWESREVCEDVRILWGCVWFWLHLQVPVWSHLSDVQEVFAGGWQVDGQGTDCVGHQRLDLPKTIWPYTVDCWVGMVHIHDCKIPQDHDVTENQCEHDHFAFCVLPSFLVYFDIDPRILRRLEDFTTHPNLVSMAFNHVFLIGNALMLLVVFIFEDSNKEMRRWLYLVKIFGLKMSWMSFVYICLYLIV